MKIKEAYEKGTNVGTMYKNFDNLDSAEEFRDKMLNTWELE